MGFVGFAKENSNSTESNMCKTIDTDEWLYPEKDYESKNGEWFLAL